MELLDKLFDAAPLLALFVTLALGYVAGKFKVGRFVLGGIAGTLLVGVVIGQLGIKIDPGVKSIFFALFIYAVGYQGGPQFFQSLNRRTINQLVSAFVMCFVGLICVLVAAWTFDLDRGTAAGLAAGGLTQSAILGTAGDAISKLDVSAEQIKTMQTNVAVGYAVTYIFGSLGPIIIATWFIPMVMGWDIRAEAVKLAQSISGGRPELDPGQFDAIKRVSTRVYKVTAASKANGTKVDAAQKGMSDAKIEAIFRDGREIDATDQTKIESGDIVAVTGLISGIAKTEGYLGTEVQAPPEFQLVEEAREIILTNNQLAGHTIQEINEHVNTDLRRGVYTIRIRRAGHDLPLLPGLELHRGDELHIVGTPKDLDRVQGMIGYKISAAAITDFVFFGIGMALGILVGMGTVKLAGVPVTLGTGGGCLLSGLLFGWLRSTHPRYAALPTGASNFLRDFGLAVFVAVVGLTAGPQAFVTIKELGVTLLLLGVAVTLLPQIITFYFSYYVLGIRNPIEALACVVGGRSANPGFAALLSKAGNATPVATFTVTYAVANVFLTLWGPLIIGIISKNAAQ